MADRDRLAELGAELLARQLLLVGGPKATAGPKANDPYSIGYVFGLTEGLLRPTSLSPDEKLQVIRKVFRRTFGFWKGRSHVATGLALDSTNDGAFNQGRFKACNEALEFLHSKMMPQAWAGYLGSILVQAADREELRSEVFRRLSKIDQNNEPAKRAEVCREALELLPRGRDPATWGALKRDLAVCLTLMEPMIRQRFDEAAMHLSEEEVFDLEEQPAQWAEIQYSLATTKGQVSETWDPGLLHQAFGHAARAAAAFAKAGQQQKSARAATLLKGLFLNHSGSNWKPGLDAIDSALLIARTKELLQLRVEIGAQVADSRCR